MYDVHRLRLLRELSQRGTLAAVAAALGYSPSAVSHQLAILAREVGEELLERTGRGVRLTRTAHVLVGHAETILRELEQAEAAVAASKGDVAGTVRIATFQTAAHTVVPPALAVLHEAHPRLDVTVSHLDAEAAIPALIAREFDVVLSERYPREPPHPRAGVSTVGLLKDPLTVSAPSAWGAADLRDLADRPWVMEHPGTSARTWSTALCREAGFEPRVSYVSADVYLHAVLVSEGLCAAVLPRLAATHPMHADDVAAYGVRVVEISVRAGNEAAPAIAAVRDALAGAASFILPDGP